LLLFNLLDYNKLTRLISKCRKNRIVQLPNKKTVVNKIELVGSKNNYTGIAQRGWVRERIQEHLGEIPGAKFKLNKQYPRSKKKRGKNN